LHLEEHGVPDSTISGYVLKARLQVHDQLHDQAIATLLAGERFCRELQILNLEPLLALERGRLCLQLGKVEMAKVIFNEQGFADTDDLSRHFSPYEAMQIETFHIRLLIVQDKPEKALNCLNQLITKCSYKNYWSLLTVLYVLKARVLADSQDVLKAMRILEKAIEIVASENSLRILIDEKQHLEFLLPKLVQAKEINPKDTNQLDPNSYISKLCQSLNIDAGLKEYTNHEEGNSECRLESLTKRESAILNILEQGLSNQKLAESLFVSLPTIKWHLSNIYGKLGVANKIQAINVAKKR
jgi:LuxR family maltose regulon positive regulatory protein